MPLGQFAKDVLDHHHGAVDDDAEVDRADRQQIRRNVSPVETDEREEQGEGNRDGDDQRRADAEQKDAEDHQHEQHAAKQVALDGLGRLSNQLRAVVVRHDLDVRRQDAAVQRRRELFDLLENHLRLLADAHQDDAFDRVVLLHVAELTEPRRRPDCDVADVVDRHGNAAARRDHDVADVLERLHEAEAADVVELPALRIEAAAGVRVVAGQLLNDLRHRDAVRHEPVAGRSAPGTAWSRRRGSSRRRRPEWRDSAARAPSPRGS